MVGCQVWMKSGIMTATTHKWKIDEPVRSLLFDKNKEGVCTKLKASGSCRAKIMQNHSVPTFIYFILLSLLVSYYFITTYYSFYTLVKEENL